MMAKIGPSQSYFENTAANTEAYFGHLGKSRELSRRADAALTAGAKERAAYVMANAALQEVLFGDPVAARRNANAALSQSGGPRGMRRAAGQRRGREPSCWRSQGTRRGLES
jgi:hypothetical protein